MIVLRFFAGGVEFRLFGDSSVPMNEYNKVLAEARAFILACYNMRDCESLSEARVKVWQNKMKRKVLEPPKLCSLPPTETAFRENALRAHLAVCVMLSCLENDPPSLDPTKHGWYRPEGSTVLHPVVVPPHTPLAPSDLLKFIRCGCASDKPCASRRCTCKSNGLRCTLFCSCRGEEDCSNKP